jgi:hypothetical protein
LPHCERIIRSPRASDISVAVQQREAISKEIARSASAAAERTRDVSMSVAQVSDGAAKTGKLRAEVERFLAQIRVAGYCRGMCRRVARRSGKNNEIPAMRPARV